MDDFHDFVKKHEYFRQALSAPLDDAAVSFFVSLRGFDDLDRLLEGIGLGFEAESCSFPCLIDEDDNFDGVKFSLDLFGDAGEEYAETVLSYEQFLDAMCAASQWHLRYNPDNEDSLRRSFHARNLQFLESAQENQDDGATWWRKCRQKEETTRSLRLPAFAHGEWDFVTHFLLQLREPRYLDFLVAATRHEPFQVREVFLEFPDANHVRWRESEKMGEWNLRAPGVLELESEQFYAMLKTLAVAYAERRPQHATLIKAML